MQNFLVSQGGTSPLRLPPGAQAHSRSYLSTAIGSHPPQCQKRIYATDEYLISPIEIKCKLAWFQTVMNQANLHCLQWG